MAIISKNKRVTINRGDTFLLPVELNVGSGINPDYHEMVEGDMLYFALLEPHQRWEDAILRKAFDYKQWQNNKENVPFSSEDTEYLLPGTYYYQVKLYIAKDYRMNNNESVTTVVPRTAFIILE